MLLAESSNQTIHTNMDVWREIPQTDLHRSDSSQSIEFLKCAFLVFGNIEKRCYHIGSIYIVKLLDIFQFHSKRNENKLKNAPKIAHVEEIELNLCVWRKSHRRLQTDFVLI